MSFKLDVVGTMGESQAGLMYEPVLVDNYGIKRKIWGFGVDNIMETHKPIVFVSSRTRCRIRGGSGETNRYAIGNNFSLEG